MEKEKLRQYFADHRQEMIDDIANLIRIDSVNGEATPGMPFGEKPTLALKQAKTAAKRMGLKAFNCDNHVVIVDLNDQPPRLDILAHLDVVPGGEGWTMTQPFIPLVREGRLYGRGASDDKGPAMAALYALRAVRDMNLPLTGNTRLILGADEETACRDIAYYYSHCQEAPFTFSPDACYPVINTEKGGLYSRYSASWEEDFQLPRILKIQGGTAGNVVPGRAEATVEGLPLGLIRDVCAEVEAASGIAISIEPGEHPGQVALCSTGAGAHASTPWEGRNALTGLLQALIVMPFAQCRGFSALQGLGRIFPHGDYYGVAAGIAQQDTLSGPLTLCTNVLSYSLTGLEGKLDCRAPLCASDETVRQVLQRQLAEVGVILDPDSAMTPPHHVPAESPYIQTLLACYEEVMEEEGYCMEVGGGTYAHRLRNGVAFGCMKTDVDYHMHGADEFLVIDEILRSAELFARVIMEVCK